MKKKLAKIGIIIGVLLVLSVPVTVLAEGEPKTDVDTAAHDPGGGGGY